MHYLFYSVSINLNTNQETVEVIWSFREPFGRMFGTVRAEGYGRTVAEAREMAQMTRQLFQTKSEQPVDENLSYREKFVA